MTPGSAQCTSCGLGARLVNIDILLYGHTQPPLSLDEAGLGHCCCGRCGTVAGIVLAELFSLLPVYCLSTAPSTADCVQSICVDLSRVADVEQWACY